jgi:hypothetical protein
MGMTWQFSTWPVNPQYWRATPTDLTPFFMAVVSSAISTASGRPRCSTA